MRMRMKMRMKMKTELTIVRTLFAVGLLVLLLGIIVNATILASAQGIRRSLLLNVHKLANKLHFR